MKCFGERKNYSMFMVAAQAVFLVLNIKGADRNSVSTFYVKIL